MTHKRLDEAEKSAVLVRPPVPLLSFLLPVDLFSRQDLVSEPRTQATRADNSVTLSHSSLVLPRGGTQAEKHTENKPKLAEYACSFYEVDSYVNAVVSQVIPRAFWGSEVNQQLVQRRASFLFFLRLFIRLTLFPSQTSLPSSVCAAGSRRPFTLFFRDSPSLIVLGLPRPLLRTRRTSSKSRTRSTWGSGGRC
jgi:hypothetical protein